MAAVTRNCCHADLRISQRHIANVPARAVTCTSVTICILGEALPQRVCMRTLPRNHQSRRTRSALVACGAGLTLLLQLLASSQLESNFNSESNLVLDAPMSSGAVHLRYACMGCTARSNCSGEPILSMTTKQQLCTTRSACTAASP